MNYSGDSACIIEKKRIESQSEERLIKDYQVELGQGYLCYPADCRTISKAVKITASQSLMQGQQCS